MNRRSEIRKGVAHQIRKGLPNVRVFSSRSTPLQEMELPSVVLSIEHEGNEEISRSGPELKKTAILSIDVVVDGEEGRTCDDLDLISARIECILHEDEFLQDQINRIVLRDTEIAYIREGELDLVIARMNYVISYFSRYETEGAEMVDFTGSVVHLGGLG